MRILILGDIVGKPGRHAVTKNLANIVGKYNIEFVIANVDNVAHGLGINEGIAKDLLNSGVHAMTGGNHIVDKHEIFPFMEEDHRLLRPINFNKLIPGVGHAVYHLPDNRKILVLHAMGQVFMNPILDSPFHALDSVIKSYHLKRNIDTIVVDFHAEATSEKYAMGHFLDGRVSCVVGTHTHVPTSDAHIMEHGTGFISDIGMNGDYNSVIGANKEIIVGNFLRQFGFRRMEPSSNEGTFCGVVLETDEKTGLAKSIEHIKIGGTLERWKTQ